MPHSTGPENMINQQHKDTLLTSFVGRSGRFYVACPEGWATNARYTVHASVEAYNSRNGLIGFVPAAESLADFEQEISIYPESLTTTPPAYPADRDESDLGLTPAHNLWAERFARVKGGQRHAA